jgi:hypothetical protein
MAENIVTYKVQIDVQSGKVAIDGLTKGFVKAETAAKRLNKTMQETTTKGLNPMIDKSGLAGAAVVEIGRVISDSNYGIRGMANNLSQLATLLTTLIVTTKGAKNAWDALMKSFKGPLGIIVVFQIAIALLERFAINNEKSSKASQDAASKLRSQSEVLRLLNEELRSSNLTMEKREKILNTLVYLDKDLSKVLEFYNGNLEKQSQLLEQVERLKSKEADATEAQKAATERLTVINEQLNEKRAFAHRLSISSTSSTRQYLAVTDEVAALEKEQKKIKEDLINAQSELTKEQKAYAAEIKAVNDEIARRNKLEALLLKWNERRLEAETNSELELLNLKERFAIKEAKELGATKKQLLDIERYYQIQRYNLEREGLEKVEILRKGKVVDASRERKTELQLWAEEQLKTQNTGWEKELNALAKALKKREDLRKKKEEEAAKLAKERQDFLINAAVETLFSTFDLMDAEYERQITLEQNKTTALNNELRLRLQNENLSKEERARIQNEIANNDEKLRVKQEAIEKKRFKLNKAAQISNALINTASLILKAADLFVFPSPAGIAAVGLASAMGAMQVAAIAKQKFQTSANSNPSVSSGSSSGVEVQAPDFNIVGQSASNQLAEAVKGQLSQPIKTYVVSKDVSTAQEMERNIIGSASLG